MRRPWTCLALLLLGGCGRAEPAKPAKDMNLEDLEAGAKAGRPDALGELGNRYYFGRGVERSLERASDLIRRAAELNDLGSMHNLAVMLQKGEGMEKDEPAALRWYVRAAEAGHPESARFAGLMYKLGVGTEPNPREALRWLEKSGSPQVYGSVAMLYFDGGDYARARDWWLKAARQGDAIAYGRLADLFERGLGGPADAKEASRWEDLFRATSLGAEVEESVIRQFESEPEVLHAVALDYAKKGNSEAAYKIMSRAAQAGSAPAKEWLKTHAR